MARAYDYTDDEMRSLFQAVKIFWDNSPLLWDTGDPVIENFGFDGDPELGIPIVLFQSNDPDPESLKDLQSFADNLSLLLQEDVHLTIYRRAADITGKFEKMEGIDPE